MSISTLFVLFGDNCSLVGVLLLLLLGLLGTRWSEQRERENVNKDCAYACGMHTSSQTKSKDDIFDYRHIRSQKHPVTFSDVSNNDN
jgi:NADH:ubiquinone oxidoreductase subunit 3 (subunit A)